MIVVRKLGVPYQRELAFGAVGEDGVMVFNRDVVELAGLTEQQIAEVVTRERAEVARRAERFRGRPARVPLAGRTVVIVDDGIATGATARAACQVARAHGAERVVLAVPVGPPDIEARLRQRRRRAGVPAYPAGVLRGGPVLPGLPATVRRGGGGAAARRAHPPPRLRPRPRWWTRTCRWTPGRCGWAGI